jgi:hypothetical protein
MGRGEGLAKGATERGLCSGEENVTAVHSVCHLAPISRSKEWLLGNGRVGNADDRLVADP